LFNLYGPFPTVQHLIASVLSQAARGDRLVLGDLRTARDYVYVEDAAGAVVALLRQGTEGTINVGTGMATPGHEVVRLVSALLGRTLVTSVDATRLRTTDRPSLVAATGRLATALPQWSAMALREGLARSIRERRAATSAGPHPV
jgi:UDP-glucose 4-epimerase